MIIADKEGKKFSNPDLQSVVASEGQLKTWLVETMSHEFPEFLMSVAEENFIRGYRQGVLDTDTGWGLLNVEQPK